MAFSLLFSTFIARLPKWVAASLLLWSIAISASICRGADQATAGVSTRDARMQAIQAVPFKQMNQTTAQALRDVLDNPSFYRRMPTQTIECDPELFAFLVRKPEVMVNTWDLMGITKVTAKRTGPYSFLANDGVGTKCKCDLVYGADNIHIYYGSGDYDGSMSARLIKGRAVCILRSDNQPYPQGHSGHIVRGTMDVFLKLDNLGADLLTRTFGPLVAKTADHNFAETAQFVSQLSQICAKNPPAALGLATQLNNIDEQVRQEFTSIATRIADDCQIANKATVGSSADPALMAHTLQELRSTTGVNNPAQGRSVESATSSSSPESIGAKTSVPPMQLSLSNSNSARKQPATDAGQVPSAGIENWNNLPPSRILPKKTGVTMRR